MLLTLRKLQHYIVNLALGFTDATYSIINYCEPGLKALLMLRKLQHHIVNQALSVINTHHSEVLLCVFSPASCLSTASETHALSACIEMVTVAIYSHAPRTLNLLVGWQLTQSHDGHPVALGKRCHNPAQKNQVINALCTRVHLHTHKQLYNLTFAYTTGSKYNTAWALWGALPGINMGIYLINVFSALH